MSKQDNEEGTMDATATKADRELKARAIGIWLDRHDIRIQAMTTAEAERVTLAYFVALAKDEAEAWAEEHAREHARWMRMVAESGPHNTPRTKRCSNEWHRSAPKRAEILCPEC